MVKKTVKRVPNKLKIRGLVRQKRAKNEIKNPIANTVDQEFQNNFTVTHETDEEINIDNLKNEGQATIAIRDESSEEHDRIRSASRVGKCGILLNGLVNSVAYYSFSHSYFIKIGTYRAKVKIPLSYTEFQLTAREMYDLPGKTGWINSIIIDCFIATRMDHWGSGDISYMSTDLSNKAIGNLAPEKKSKMAEILNIKTPVKNKLLIPYVYAGHYRLVYVDKVEETFALLDPYEVSWDEDRVFQAFLDYLKEVKGSSSLTDLKYIDWNRIDIKDRPYQAATDSSNCGLYIAYYIYCIGNNVGFNLSFDPVAYRQEVAEALIMKSEDMRNKCMYCFGVAKKGITRKICTICNRWMHSACSKSGNVDTSDEENSNCYTLPRKRKKKVVEQEIENSDKNGDYVTCKLCNRFNSMDIKKVKIRE